MLATGCRIGESLAAQLESVELDAGTWEINATVIRVKGEGLMIQPRPKTEAGWRRIAIPPYAVRMVQRRRDEVAALERFPGPTIFGNPRNKALRDPSNATGDLREALDGLDCPACNYTGWQLNDDGTFKMDGKNRIPCRLGPWSWVTSHVFRKTVATRLDEAGFSGRQIADQLGHAKPSMTLDVYMGRKVVNADAARILDR
jgi:integrase